MNARVVLVAGLIASTLLLPAEAQERGDRLDQPLRQANWCGVERPGDVRFTLAATGDTFPHENIQYVGETAGYTTLFDHIRPFLKAADLAYTNFDGAMLADSPYSGYPVFNYNPALAPALRDAGITLVSTANNHILDRGPEGLDATLRVLAEAGIQQHGTAPSGQARPAYLPLTLTRNGATLRIGFISASWGTNGIPDPYDQVNLLWQSNEYGQQGGVRQSVLDAVAQARRESDLVVVAAHWGSEYQFYPDQAQIDGAHALAQAGADVILGAQSHTLQPVDVIDTNGRRTLVIYSLANFLASQGAFQSQYFSATSVVLYVGLVRHADGSAAVTGFRYLPTIMSDNDTRPAPLGLDDLATLEHVRLIMRDPGGVHQVSGDAAHLGGYVDVCAPLSVPGAPEPVPGDFARVYQTLGGDGLRPLDDALGVLGVPLGPVARGPSGDCSGEVDVLLTERARLELHPEADWPYRVVGAQLGTLAMRQEQPDVAPQPRTDLGPGAFADPAFEAFFTAYGGLATFGYPISAALRSPGGIVQYFERARFELAENGSVQLAPLGREFGAAVLCDGAQAVNAVPAQAPMPTAGAANAALPSPTPVGTQPAVQSPAGMPTPATRPEMAGAAPQRASATEVTAATTGDVPRWVLWAGLPVGMILTLGSAWQAWRGFATQRRQRRAGRVSTRRNKR